MSENRWKLTPGIIDKYLDEVTQAVQQIQESSEGLEIDFTGKSGLNPSRMQELLLMLGYGNDDEMDTNGWQWDFWSVFSKAGCTNIQMSGCGMTFELKLSSIK